jgi:hypothetical protein
LPDDDGRNALPDDRLGARVLPQRSVSVRVDVDESRRDDMTADIELDPTRVTQVATDRCDTPVRDGDIGFDSSTTASIDHLSAAQHDVIAPTLGEEHRWPRGESGGAKCPAKNEITT